MRDYKFIRSTIIYGLGDFLVSGLTSFLLIPIYTRLLTKEEYGIFNIVNTNSTIFLYFIQLGIPSVFSILFYQYKRAKDEFRYIETIFWFHLCYSIVYLLLFLLWGDKIWGVLSPQVQSNPFKWYAICLAIFNFIPGIYYLKYRLEELPKLFVVSQILQVVLVIASVFVFYKFSKNYLFGFLNALILSNFLVYFFFIVKTILKLKGQIDFIALKKTLKLAFFIFISYISYFIANKFSLIYLQRYVSLEEIGLFAFAQQIATGIIIISTAFGKAIQPLIYSCNMENVSFTAGRVGRIYKFGMITLCVILVLFLKEIVLILAPESYLQSIYILLILIIANLMYVIAFVENTLLLYYHKTNLSFYATLFGAISNVVLNLILVPKFTLLGSSVALLISFTIVMFFNYYFSYTYLKINKNYLFLILYFLFLVSLCFLVVFWGDLLSFSLQVFLKTILSLICIFFVFRVIMIEKENHNQ